MGGKQKKQKSRKAGQKRSGVCGGQRPFCLVASLWGTLSLKAPAAQPVE